MLCNGIVKITSQHRISKDTRLGKAILPIYFAPLSVPSCCMQLQSSPTLDSESYKNFKPYNQKIEIMLIKLFIILVDNFMPIIASQGMISVFQKTLVITSWIFSNNCTLNLFCLHEETSDM